MSTLAGVFEAKDIHHKIYYRSSLTFKRKHISLGSFACEKTASNCYLEAKSIIHDKSIMIHNYHSSSLLSFDKWVSIINFRDNNIYFKNPIYLKNKYFLYFLSPNEEIKFDIDDLFYYANHKIMKRNRHLCVADYGMQVTILSRYGIRPYSVAGKDYVFINGDNLDFRYHNIKVVNPYYGVRKVMKKGTLLYRATIHVNGNFLIGTYPTEETAAVAYNKAIDILKRNGVMKNYTFNYIETLSASDYAKLYTDISISKKITEYSII